MRILYIHHPDCHPAHAAYARAAGADFMVEDHFFSYCHHIKLARMRRYISLIITWLKFPYKKYDAIITDEPQLFALGLKIFSFGRLRLIATQASITLNRYFEKKIPSLGSGAFKRIYNNYDLIIAIGDIQYGLAKRMCENNNRIKIVQSFNGVSQKIVDLKNEVKYNPSSVNIIAIANIPTDEIFYVKGIDIALQVFIELKKQYQQYSFLLIGNINHSLKEKIEKDYSCAANNIYFTGGKTDFKQYFNEALCLFQFSRMDAWGLTVNEVLYTGIPAFMSDRVGARSILNTSDLAKNFIIDINRKDECLDKIKNFIQLPAEEKSAISGVVKSISSTFTEEAATQNYKNIVAEYFKQP